MRIAILVVMIAFSPLVANAQTKTETPSKSASQEKPASPEIIPVSEADALPWRSAWLDAQLKRTEAALLNEQASKLDAEAKQRIIDLAALLKIDLSIYEPRLGGSDNRQLFFVRQAPTKADPKKD